MLLLRVLAAILAISLLVIIHELGHYLVARAFGMRVMTFSVGFGPALFRFRPKGSDTVFQLAAIPVLAYVQIAGMNPHEPVDPGDRGSYQNASPIARFLTIAAGPLANYLAAGFLVFLMFAAGGEQLLRPRLEQIAPNSPAAAAGLRSGDLVRQIDGRAIPEWEDMVKTIVESHGRPLRVELDRAGQRVSVVVTPRMNAEMARYTIGVTPRLDDAGEYRPVPLALAARAGIVRPAMGIVEMVSKIGEGIRHKEAPKPMGIINITDQVAQQMKHGWRQGVDIVAIISLNLFLFNLLPIPALDGGRLVVLAYEMATRRRPNPKLEARVLAGSIMVLLSLFIYVTAREAWEKVAGLFHG